MNPPTEKTIRRILCIELSMARVKAVRNLAIATQDVILLSCKIRPLSPVHIAANGVIDSAASEDRTGTVVNAVRDAGCRLSHCFQKMGEVTSRGKMSFYQDILYQANTPFHSHPGFTALPLQKDPTMLEQNQGASGDASDRYAGQTPASHDVRNGLRAVEFLVQGRVSPCEEDPGRVIGIALKAL